MGQQDSLKTGDHLSRAPRDDHRWGMSAVWKLCEQKVCVCFLDPTTLLETGQNVRAPIEKANVSPRNALRPRNSFDSISRQAALR